MKNNKRETNFEFLRIICMIMIVILHFNKYGLVLANIAPNTMAFYILNFLEYFCVIAVNCYILITGYFMINKQIKIRKIIDLELELLFYTIFIYLALLVTNQVTFTIKDTLKVLLPTLTCAYWFMSTYILLYILIPYINKFAKQIEKKEYFNLLLILTLLLTIGANILPIKSVININSGYSLIWFIYLYLLGGYINIHSIKIFDKLKKYQLSIIYFLIVILMLGGFITYNRFIDSTSYMMFLAYNSPLILFNAIVIFYFFKKITIKEKFSSIINNISSKTLAVYLIHLHPIFKTILWEKILHPTKYIDSYKIFLALIIDVVLIFLISYIIEFIRISIHNKLRLSEKITKILKVD